MEVECHSPELWILCTQDGNRSNNALCISIIILQMDAMSMRKILELQMIVYKGD